MDVGPRHGAAAAEACSAMPTARPVIPIFINSVATPLGPLRRVESAGHRGRKLPVDAGQAGSGRLDRVVCLTIRRCRTLATAPPAALGPDRARRADDRRAAPSASGGGDGGRTRTSQHGQSSASAAQPGLGPRASSKSLDTSRLSDRSMPGRTAWIEHTRRATRRTKSAPGWPLSPHWPHRARTRPSSAFYRAAPELIAGFADADGGADTDDLESPAAFDHDGRRARHRLRRRRHDRGARRRRHRVSTPSSSRSRRSSADPPRCRAAASGSRCADPAQRGLRSRPRRRVRVPAAGSPADCVSDARLRQYVDTAPEMMEFLEKLSPLVRVRLETGLR